MGLLDKVLGTSQIEDEDEDDWWDTIEYFTKEEMACNCGHKDCPRHGMAFMQMKRLDQLRRAYGGPLAVSSGFRCRNHSRERHKNFPGSHVEGKATDIPIFGSNARTLIGLAIKCGFGGIGVYQSGDISSRFVHVDTVSPTSYRSRPWIWTYDFP